jgi:hypothetical protein
MTNDDPIWNRPEIFDDRDAMIRNSVDLARISHAREVHRGSE